MKIELFLEKLNSDVRVDKATKEKALYKVVLAEEYVFKNFNCRNADCYNQESVSKMMETVVPRNSEQIEIFDKIIKLERRINEKKFDIKYHTKKIIESNSYIWTSKKSIREYKRYIELCLSRVDECEKEIEFNQKEVEKDNEILSQLEKELELKKNELK